MNSALPRWFLRLSLARKLTVLATATSAVSVAIACIGLAFYDAALVRADLIEDTETLADSLALNNTATLSFGDNRGAAESLTAAAVDESLQVAAIIDHTGKVFARYDRAGRPQTPLAVSADTLRRGGALTQFFDDRIIVVRPVRLDREVLGMAYVDLSLADVHARLVAFRRALGGAVLGAVALAMFIGWRLQKAVSRPLLHLTEVTRAVARDRDYDLRAEQMSDDEVGELARSFNDMLAHIRARDAKLESHRQELERTVDERTAELKSSVDRFKQLVESTNAVPWEMTGASSAFSYISPQAVRLFGFESQALVGSSRVDLQACKLEYSIVSPK